VIDAAAANEATVREDTLLNIMADNVTESRNTWRRWDNTEYGEHVNYKGHADFGFQAPP